MQPLRDTVNDLFSFEDCTIFGRYSGKFQLMTAKKAPMNRPSEPALPFDVTQEIDPALAEQLRRTGEPTLTQTDFDDVTIVLPEKPKVPA